MFDFAERHPTSNLKASSLVYGVDVVVSLQKYCDVAVYDFLSIINPNQRKHVSAHM